MFIKTLIRCSLLLITLTANFSNASNVIELIQSEPWDFEAKNEDRIKVWGASTEFTNSGERGGYLSLTCVDMRELKRFAEQVEKTEINESELVASVLSMPLPRRLDYAEHPESLIIEIDNHLPYVMTELRNQGGYYVFAKRRDIYHFDNIIEAMYTGKEMTLTLTSKLYNSINEKMYERGPYNIQKLVYKVQLSSLRDGLHYYKKHCSFLQ